MSLAIGVDLGAEHLEIAPAELGDDAGILGAVRYGFEPIVDFRTTRGIVPLGSYVSSF